MGKFFKVLGITACIFLCYFIIGMLAPFIDSKPVSEEYENKIDTARFYADSGNQSSERAAVIEDNKEALDIRLSMIADAQKEIVLSTFDIRPGSSTTDIFSALIEAADRGVNVRILVDGMYGMLHMKWDADFFAAGAHDKIEIKFYNMPNPLKPWTMHGRMHDKYILADNTMLLMGGRNTFDYFVGDYEKELSSYDREVFLYKEDANTDNTETGIAQVWEYFNKMWENPVCKTVYNKLPEVKKKAAEEAAEAYRSHYRQLTFEKTDYALRTVPVKQTVLISNPTHIYGKEPYVFAELTALMEQAKERIMIHTPYAVFSREMYEDMTRIKEKTGEMDMMINSVMSGDNICASADYMRNKPEVLNTGIDVYEFMGKNSTHGKSIVIDNDISVIGSYNFDIRSTYVNTEMMLVIDSEELNSELTANMERLQDLSLLTDPETDEYIYKEGVAPGTISKGKKLLIYVLSWTIQGFRYLV